jgi:hypothetical protein
MNLENREAMAKLFKDHQFEGVPDTYADEDDLVEEFGYNRV